MSETSTVIPVARPWLEQAEADAASRAILSGWVTQGPEVAAFEREFAEWVGAPHAVAVSNCTAALFLALKLVGVTEGDEVVTVSHSFIATANSIRYLGAKPVFVDIDPASYNIDPGRLEAALGSRTKAVLVVHQVGMPADTRAIVDMARPRHIAVVEDAACAVGSEVQWEGHWERIGKPHGDIACFSFHPRKLLTTGDGGMLTTARADWDARLRLWRQHSMSVNDTVRHQSTQVIHETYPELGYNYRLTDIQAAVGREQLKRLPAVLSRRRAQVARYRDGLQNTGWGFPQQPDWARSNWQSLCLRLPPGQAQGPVMQALLDRGIATRPGVMCAHRQASYPPGTWTCEPGTPACPHGSPACPRLVHSVSSQQDSVIVPLFHQMTNEQQDEVVAALKEVTRGR